MAPPDAPTPPPRPSQRHWQVSFALLIAVLTTVAGLHVILDRGGWWFALALESIVLLGSGTLTRYLSRLRALPTVVEAVVLLLGLTLSFAPGTAVLGLIPTGATLDAFGALFDEAGISIARQSLPATADTGITFLLCFGIGAIVVVADLVAVTRRAPALAGIPLLVLLAIPSVVSIDSTDPFIFIISAFAFLFLLRAGLPRRQSRLSIGFGVVVVVLSLLLPPVLPSVIPAEDANGSGLSTGVNPVVTLGRDLRRGVVRTVLVYSTVSGSSEYLRLVSIDDFRGQDWAPNRFDLNPANTPNNIGNPPGLSAEVTRVRDTTVVSVEELASPWLPLPYPTASVSGLSGSWYWDADGLAVQSPTVTADNETYRVTSIAPTPTPAQLEAAGTTVPDSFQRFLALPSDTPAIIEQTATAVAGGASSNYEKALLLQNFFRDGDFTYSASAPVKAGYDGTGVKVIAAFLAAKSGYCIHFASAMAAMARSLGIPSRVSIGFLPGHAIPSDVGGAVTYKVTSHDLHAWPELYFEGIGWTRFEPTVSRGEIPLYADQSSAGVPVPVNTPVPSASPSASAGPNSQNGRPVRGDVGGVNTGTVGIVAGFTPLISVLAGVLALLILLLVPAPVRALQRFRRLRELAAGRADAITAWVEVLQSAEDLGDRIPDSATPHEVTRLLAAGALADDPALARLRDAVERQSYSREAGAGYDEAAADTKTIIAKLGRAAGARDRLRAAIRPASIWRQILAKFGFMLREQASN